MLRLSLKREIDFKVSLNNKFFKNRVAKNVRISKSVMKGCTIRRGCKCNSVYFRRDKHPVVLFHKDGKNVNYQNRCKIQLQDGTCCVDLKKTMKKVQNKKKTTRKCKTKERICFVVLNLQKQLF